MPPAALEILGLPPLTDLCYDCKEGKDLSLTSLGSEKCREMLQFVIVSHDPHERDRMSHVFSQRYRKSAFPCKAAWGNKD